MRENKEIEELKAQVKYLEKSFENLASILIKTKIIEGGFLSSYQRYFHSTFWITHELPPVIKKLDAILNHLGLEFEWINCKPHYELKEKDK